MNNFNWQMGLGWILAITEDKWIVNARISYIYRELFYITISNRFVVFLQLDLVKLSVKLNQHLSKVEVL